MGPLLVDFSKGPGYFKITCYKVSIIGVCGLVFGKLQIGERVQVRRENISSLVSEHFNQIHSNLLPCATREIAVHLVLDQDFTGIPGLRPRLRPEQVAGFWVECAICLRPRLLLLFPPGRSRSGQLWKGCSPSTRSSFQQGWPVFCCRAFGGSRWNRVGVSISRHT